MKVQRQDRHKVRFCPFVQFRPEGVFPPKTNTKPAEVVRLLKGMPVLELQLKKAFSDPVWSSRQNCAPQNPGPEQPVLGADLVTLGVKMVLWGVKIVVLVEAQTLPNGPPGLQSLQEFRLKTTPRVSKAGRLLGRENLSQSPARCGPQ